MKKSNKVLVVRLQKNREHARIHRNKIKAARRFSAAVAAYKKAVDDKINGINQRRRYR